MTPDFFSGLAVGAVITFIGLLVGARALNAWLERKTQDLKDKYDV